MMNDIEHQGHMIRIVQDRDIQLMNPLNGGFRVKAFVVGGHGSDAYGGGIGTPALSHTQIEAFGAELCGLLDVASLTQIVLDCSQEGSEPCDLVFAMNSSIECHLANCSSREHMDFVERLLTMTNTTHLRCSGHGYVQGQYHDLLICPCDDWLANDKNCISTLTVLADKFEKWLYGDVHGYQILRSNTCSCCSSTSLYEVSSSFGYFCKSGDSEWDRMVGEAKARIKTNNSGFGPE